MFRFYFIIILNLFRAPYTIPKLIYMANHKDQYSVEERYSVVKRLINIIKRSGNIWTKAFGKENLPKEGGYIMFSNHQGKYDALGILHTHDKPCSVVMDEERSHILIASQVVDLCDGKRLNRSDVRQSMKIILEMAEEAKAGKRFVIFPEGGYNHNRNRVQEFKAGCFKSAMKAKVPIVPVAIIDSYKAFEGFCLGRVKTQVHYLPPIPYEEYKDMKTVEIAELVRERIINKIETVLEERKRRKLLFFIDFRKFSL